jgi:hypothetical protein
MNSTRRFGVVSLYTLLSLAILSCSDNNAIDDTDIGGAFEAVVRAGVDDKVVYSSGGAPFSVKVISIEDSRCPSDVVCMWQGMAKVRFSLTGVSAPFDLYLGGGHDQPNSTTYLFDGKTYRLTLVDVTPYPSTDSAHLPKKAHFEVCVAK